MIRLGPEPAIVPAEWMIVFRRDTKNRLARWLSFGRYCHVMCFGYVPAVDGWLFFDFGVNATAVAVVPDRRANPMIAAAIDGALVVRWVSPMPTGDWRLKPAFVCTTAVAHLAGVPSSALRPDALLRDLLANRGEIVQDDELRHPELSARPDAHG